MNRAPNLRMLRDIKDQVERGLMPLGEAINLLDRNEFGWPDWVREYSKMPPGDYVRVDPWKMTLRQMEVLEQLQMLRPNTFEDFRREYEFLRGATSDDDAILANLREKFAMPADIKMPDLEAAMRQMVNIAIGGGGGGGYMKINAGDINIVNSIKNSDREYQAMTLRAQLDEARTTIKEQQEVLEQIAKEPLISHTISRISKCGKYTFVKKGEQELRIQARKDLKVGHVVMLHPKTLQIVENTGYPPLEAGQFAPAEIPNVKWSDIGGLEEAKQDMIEAIEMPHREKELFAFYKKRPVKGILLSGPPGCGKTMLGKAAATALSEIYGKESARTGFLYVKAPEILNSYVGASEETVREIFSDARRHAMEHGYPAIIFIDEAEAILAKRGGMGFSMSNTIVPSFLTEMDGLESSSAIVILATNRPDILDPAIVREGRIDRKVSVKRPSVKNATDIIAMSLERYPVADGWDLMNMAEGMAHEIYSDNRMINGDKYLRDIVNGAMLAACVDLAVANAMRRDIEARKDKAGQAEPDVTPKGKKVLKVISDPWKPTGITPDDVLLAVARIHHQNNGLQHDFDGVEK